MSIWYGAASLTIRSMSIQIDLYVLYWYFVIWFIIVVNISQPHEIILACVRAYTNILLTKRNDLIEYYVIPYHSGHLADLIFAYILTGLNRSNIYLLSFSVCNTIEMCGYRNNNNPLIIIKIIVQSFIYFHTHTRIQVNNVPAAAAPEDLPSSSDHLIPSDVYQSINQSLELKCLFDAHIEQQHHQHEVGEKKYIFSRRWLSACLLCSCYLSICWQSLCINWQRARVVRLSISLTFIDPPRLQRTAHAATTIHNVFIARTYKYPL